MKFDLSSYGPEIAIILTPIVASSKSPYRDVAHMTSLGAGMPQRIERSLLPFSRDVYSIYGAVTVSNTCCSPSTDLVHELSLAIYAERL